MIDRKPARFTGIRTYNDPLGRFTIRHPTDWEQFELEDGRDGVMWVPDTRDLETNFSVWLTELEEGVVAEDLEALKEGVDEGLASLPDCHVESAEEETISNIVKFERVFTFTHDGRTAKRKTWILYVDVWQMVLTWQGSTEEEYKYWLAMANYSFATFNLPEALWFATDRELEDYRKEQIAKLEAEEKQKSS